MHLSSPQPRCILIVDDEPFVRDSFRRLLQFDGHTVRVAASGSEALTLLREFRFDLVVTDYEMPVMKGDQLAIAIKAFLPSQPILMVSAYGEQLRSSSNLLAAVDAILTKPLQIEDLREAITRLAM
jgi:CheY-like chemotaxis protein